MEGQLDLFSEADQGKALRKQLGLPPNQFGREEPEIVPPPPIIPKQTFNYPTSVDVEIASCCRTRFDHLEKEVEDLKKESISLTNTLIEIEKWRSIAQQVLVEIGRVHGYTDDPLL